VRGARLAAQMSGNRFEEICRAFLENTFLQLGHLRPGTWRIRRGSRALIASHEQYAHLTALEQAARRDPQLAAAYGGHPLLHASISCKWTIRSDRAQNSRTEALNLVRNRKGHLPHVVVVTGEPLPSRLASIALGTGDIDCVYHFALMELKETIQELNFLDAQEMLNIMVDGKRLKDIADLPLDLAV
jgi:hypothetical protein